TQPSTSNPYPLSLHDALPIFCVGCLLRKYEELVSRNVLISLPPGRNSSALKRGRAETSTVPSTPINLWLNLTRTLRAAPEPIFLIEIDSSPRSKTKSTIT